MIERSPLPGWQLMAGDEILANPKVLSDFSPVVRFYCWIPSAVSLGVHQSANAVDHDKCTEHGWDIVRRPTGGRALLHHRDLSYSVTLAGGSESPHRLKDIYEAVAKAWIETFAKFGLVAELVQSGRGSHEGTAHLRDGLCLDSRVRGELISSGKKIAAAAQRVYAQTLLQHGSVIMTGDVSAIADTLPIDETAKNIAASNLRLSSISICELINRELDTFDLIEAAIDPFERHLNFEFVTDCIHEHELEAIHERRPFHDIHSAHQILPMVVNA